MTILHLKLISPGTSSMFPYRWKWIHSRGCLFIHLPLPFQIGNQGWNGGNIYIYIPRYLGRLPLWNIKYFSWNGPRRNRQMASSVWGLASMARAGERHRRSRESDGDASFFHWRRNPRSYSHCQGGSITGQALQGSHQKTHSNVLNRSTVGPKGSKFTSTLNLHYIFSISNRFTYWFYWLAEA